MTLAVIKQKSTARIGLALGVVVALTNIGGNTAL